jgi:hypothetical protein
LEEEAISDHEAEILREQLTAIAREEFEPYLAAQRIELENRRAARVQELLNCRIVRELLQVKAGSDMDGALFWPTLREAENMVEERDRLLISDMPLDILHNYQHHLPYDLNLPTIGDHVPIQVPRFALKAAVDTAKRAAESMKSKRSELFVSRVMARLERDAAERRRMIASNAP